MNLYDTIGGIIIAAEKLRSDIGVTDRIMHEINGKIMGSPSQYETKKVWTEIYQDWVPLALSHPLVRDPMARVSKEDVQSTAIRVAKMRERALTIYARWKSEMHAAFSNALNPAYEGRENAKDRLLRGALVGAALIGGIAALRSMLAPSPPALPLLPPDQGLGPGANPAGNNGQVAANGIPIKIVLPSTPSMATPSTKSFEFTIPPEAITTGGGD